MHKRPGQAPEGGFGQNRAAPSAVPPTIHPNPPQLQTFDQPMQDVNQQHAPQQQFVPAIPAMAPVSNVPAYQSAAANPVSGHVPAVVQVPTQAAPVASHALPVTNNPRPATPAATVASGTAAAAAAPAPAAGSAPSTTGTVTAMPAAGAAAATSAIPASSNSAPVSNPGPAPIASSSPAQVVSSVPTTIPTSVAQSHVAIPGGQPQQNFQRLKVEDALSYLDQVKLQFANQPQVYNDFLDIMKEFKSQTIDTPGVIQRVSTLFSGHPELIVGFNTFLPPGYKIELRTLDDGQILATATHTAQAQGGGTTTREVLSTSTRPTSQLRPLPTSAVSGASVSSAAPRQAPSMSSVVTASATSAAPIVKTEPTSAAAASSMTSSSSAARPVSFVSSVISNINASLGGGGASVGASAGAAAPLPGSGSGVVTATATAANVAGGIAPGVAAGGGALSSMSAAAAAAAAAGAGTGGVTATTNSAAAAAAGGGSSSNAAASGNAGNSGSEPVEFNHAISYVNKIKNRFQRQPEIYKSFLEILHTYQKEQKSMSEVYTQVARLFKNEKDLLGEFGNFLPDASGGGNQLMTSLQNTVASNRPASTSSSTAPLATKKSEGKAGKDVKRVSKRGPPTASPMGGAPPAKKIKPQREMAPSDAARIDNYCEFTFFEKVRKALRNQDVFDNFLRCLTLFNQEVLSRAELIHVVSPFLSKFPDLFTWFKQFLGHRDVTNLQSAAALANKERMASTAPDIDYSSCKRCGVSYLALPKSVVSPKCSGRNTMHKEVLNDTWVSLPLWSEDSAFLGTRKTQFEEYIFRTEDERFELDVVMETNLCCIRYLEAVQRKISQMSTEEQHKFRLDSRLGGESEVLQRKAINCIYGSKAPEIIEGLKKMPCIAVEVVLKRLKSKNAEWRDALRCFNKHWRDQNEKYYLKSLDHQGITFRTNDLRYIRSKSLVHEIENVFDEHQEKASDGSTAHDPSEPHMTFRYQDKSILEDAASLIIHHLKRQTNIQKDEKTKIKQLIQCFLPDFFFAPRGELSDDEERDDSPTGKDSGDNDISSSDSNMFYLNNTWYVFIRLHQLLCDRLQNIYRQSVIIAEREAASKQKSKKTSIQNTASVQLHLKTPTSVDVEEYYPTFLDLVRNLLDGQMEINAFEDTCREMFGVHAYSSITMDRLVQNIVRQLVLLTSEDQSIELRSMYVSELGTTWSESTDLAYRQRCEQLLGDENCYRVQLFRKDCRLTIQLVESVDNAPSDEDTAIFKDWETYVSSLVSTGNEMSPSVQESLKKKKLFLMRNINRSRRLYASKCTGSASSPPPPPANADIATRGEATAGASTDDATQRDSAAAAAATTTDTAGSSTAGATATAATPAVSSDAASAGNTAARDSTSGGAAAASDKPVGGSAANSTAPGNGVKLEADTPLPPSSPTPSGGAAISADGDASAAAATPADISAGNPSATDRDVKNAASASSDESRELVNATPAAAGCGGCIVRGALECRINLRSYKMQFVGGSADLLYRPYHSRPATQNWASVAERRLSRFHHWLDKEHPVDEDSVQQCDAWLMGAGRPSGGAVLPATTSSSASTLAQQSTSSSAAAAAAGEGKAPTVLRTVRQCMSDGRNYYITRECTEEEMDET
eukprot:scpid21185/ scgid16167/ Paired amphipathic helix protein Sin3a; Histone deacetylase complex subunit Sin3a; Transcriptional corepressor Sin3a